MRPALQTHLANELIWAVESTAHPPYAKDRITRMHIDREYARLHRLLTDLQHYVHGWDARPELYRPPPTDTPDE